MLIWLSLNVIINVKYLNYSNKNIRTFFFIFTCNFFSIFYFYIIVFFTWNFKIKDKYFLKLEIHQLIVLKDRYTNFLYLNCTCNYRNFFLKAYYILAIYKSTVTPNRRLCNVINNYDITAFNFLKNTNIIFFFSFLNKFIF